MQYSSGGNIAHATPDPPDGAFSSTESCSICRHRLGPNIICLDETGNVPTPRQSWMLCGECNAAVQAELERSPVQGPLRVRIAVGLVAAERGPTATRLIRRIIPDDAWLPFLFWGFGIVMILHIFVLVWVVSLISH